MYRADDIAIAIYDRARDWPRARFVLYVIGVDRTAPVYFENGGALEGNLKDRHMLFCDVEPQEVWPHPAWVFLWRPAVHLQPVQVDGWFLVDSAVDAKRSGIDPVGDRTTEIQLYLNRLRMREALLNFGVGRVPRQTAALFRPDYLEIAKQAGVNESIVRRFFDGYRVSPEHAEKILFAVGMRPEELEVELWGR